MKICQVNCYESYQNIFSVFQQKMALKLWKDVIVASCENAVKAKTKFLASEKQNTNGFFNRRKQKNIQIAGGLPPLAESYRHDLVGPYEENVMQYQIIVGTLLDYVDYLICETMSSIAESKSAVDAAIKVMTGKSMFYSS